MKSAPAIIIFHAPSASARSVVAWIYCFMAAHQALSHIMWSGHNSVYLKD